MSREILTRLSDATLVALAVSGGAWPRGLLSATCIPDAWMGLVERRDGRRRYVPAGDDPRADDDDTLLLVRNRPITVPLQISDARAADGNFVNAECELLVRWGAHDDDLAALRRALLSSGSALTLDHLATRLADAGGRAALRKFIAEHAAADLVQADLRGELFGALDAATKPALFEMGATLERLARVHFTSRSWTEHEALRRDAEQRVQRIQAREMVEQAALAATRKRLDDLGGLLTKLRGAAAGNDRMQWHELLPSLAPAERGQLLENLWRLTPDQAKTTAIAVVAGQECVWLDPSHPEQVQRRVTLPPTLGGLRCVCFDPARQRLLVGGATGVWAVSASDGEVLDRFEVSGAPPQRTGFNSVLIAADRLFATHSGLGCWSWPLNGEGREPHAILQPHEGTPRTVRALASGGDGRVYYAAEDCVHAYDASSGSLTTLAAADDQIHAIAVHGSDLFVGCGDGKLMRLDLRQPEDWWVPYRGSGAIESIQVRRWNDLVELVIPAGAHGVCGVYAEENVITRLLESGTPIRRAWAADDIVVGLNERRDRLIVMNSDAAERRGKEASLARLLGSSIQDACLITTKDSSSAA